MELGSLEVYGCEASNFSSLTISHINGNHSFNHSNDDVKLLKFTNSPLMKLIPRNIGNFFMNLKILHIEKSSLEEVHGTDFESIQNLTCLCLFDTKLTSLPGNFFQFLSKNTALTIAGNDIDFVNEEFMNGYFSSFKEPIFRLNMKCLTVNEENSIFVNLLNYFKKILSACTEKDKILCVFETKTYYSCTVSKYRQFDGVEKLLAIGEK